MDRKKHEKSFIPVAEDLFSNVELTAAKWNAAELLQHDSQIRSAVKLLTEVGDWERMAKLIKTVADELIEQGRHRTLTEWLKNWVFSRICGLTRKTFE
ncbi:MAG: hypothetical protein ACE5GZ_11210 [Gammaproteobacteria bacterium]